MKKSSKAFGKSARSKEGSAGRKRRPVRPTVSSNEVLFGTTALGLMALLAALTFFVLETNPGGLDTPQQIQNRLQARRALLFFHDAESMAKPFLKNPAARWSQGFLDPRSNCSLVGNGVWYAQGSIDAPTDHKTTVTYRWQEFFLTDSPKPLYVQIGDSQWGDYRAALEKAGFSIPNPGSPP